MGIEDIKETEKMLETSISPLSTLFLKVLFLRIIKTRDSGDHIVTEKMCSLPEQTPA